MRTLWQGQHPGEAGGGSFNPKIFSVSDIFKLVLDGAIQGSVSELDAIHPRYKNESIIYTFASVNANTLF